MSNFQDEARRGERPKGPAIGIDLGTTNSCMAIYLDTQVEIIPNSQGGRTTPSCVAFTDTEMLVGGAAKTQETVNPANTVKGIKRVIGRRFSDKAVKEFSDNLLRTGSFRLENQRGNPVVSVSYKNATKTYRPQEISSFVLESLKAAAEAYLGEEVQNAVITLPAYFNDAQRKATIEAGTLAGLNVIRVINEPTAAAMAYSLQERADYTRNVLVYDFGGGTLDVSILTIRKGVIEHIATNGDVNLGGMDFDQEVARFISNQIKDRVVTEKMLHRLELASEQAKCRLSAHTETTVEVASLFGEKVDFRCTLTRNQFEEICGELFARAMTPLKAVLEDANMKVADIDEVILAGGSSKIPFVQRQLRQFFDGKVLNTSIDPDEAIAYGAAVQAAILTGEKSEEIQGMVLMEITPMSLGIAVEGELMETIIKRNTAIPAKVSKMFTTSYDEQTTVDVRVLEGERALVMDNHLLGNFLLNGIPPAPRKEPQIQVTLQLDMNRVLEVSAVELSTGRKSKLTILPDKNRLTDKEIEELQKDRKKNKLEDEAIRKRVQAVNRLRDEALQFRSMARSDRFRVLMPPESQDKVEANANEVLRWISTREVGKDTTYTLDECTAKLAQLQVDCKDVRNEFWRKSATG